MKINKRLVTDLISLTLKTNKSNLVGLFATGSRVYGTDHKFSNYNFIAVIKNIPHESFQIVSDDPKINIIVFRDDYFKELVDLHEISVLECFFLNKKHVLVNNLDYDLKLDLESLRSSLIGQAEHIIVSALKKNVASENPELSKRNVFHSLRILDFGIQMAQNGQILDYSSTNDIWKEIEGIPAVTWPSLALKYRKLYIYKKETLADSSFIQ